MKFYSILRTIFFLAIALFVASCEPPQQTHEIASVKPGTVATVKISGHHYRAEATHAENGYVLWNFDWKKHPVFKYKSYRGMMNVYWEEEGFKSSSTFDETIIDNMFPLAVGKEASLQGKNYSEKKGDEFSFWATISVREKTKMKIKEAEYDVFIIDFSFIENHPEGTKNYVKTIWYWPELEISLKTDYVTDDGVFSMRVVSLDEPDTFEEDEEDEPEGLGTVRL